MPRQLRGIEFSIKVLQYRRSADCQHDLSRRLFAPPHRPSHQHQRGLRCQSIWPLQAAYNEGEEWLDELNQYLYENYQAVKEFFNTELPQVRVTRLEGTYLVWLDILPFELSSDEAYEKLMNDGKVFVNSGTMYGRKAGQGYLRLNIACPRKTLMQGLIRIARVLSQYMDEEDLSGCPA